MLTNTYRTFSFVLLIIVLITGSISADVKPSEKFKQANDLYLLKDFSGAINLYEQIISEGYESPELFYNLGNAYYRIGKLGYSILYYEKALMLSPKDEDIRHNLALANVRTIDRIETLPEFFLFQWWEGLLNFFSLKEWTVILFIFYLLVLSAAGFYFFAGTPGSQRAALISGGSALTLLLLGLALFIVRYNREVKEIKGIITADVVTVKISPEESSTDAFIVHEGLKFTVEDKLNNWSKIKLIDGKTGWIKTGEAKVI